MGGWAAGGCGRTRKGNNLQRGKPGFLSQLMHGYALAADEAAAACRLRSVAAKPSLPLLSTCQYTDYVTATYACFLAAFLASLASLRSCFCVLGFSCLRRVWERGQALPM